MHPRTDHSSEDPSTADNHSVEEDLGPEHVGVDDLADIARGLRIDSPSPVNGLPTEILAAIFILVPTPTSECSDKLDKLRPWQSLTDVREAVPLTSVCRFWRQVALSTPPLWSSILDLGVKRDPLWLHYAHRCTVGPLFVGILGVPSRETIAFLQRERLRVQELYLYAPRYPKSQNDILIDLMALSLPKLKHCALTAYTYERTASSHLAFAGQEMRKLALCGSFVPQLSPSLTHLILFNNISVLADKLLVFLAGTPHLQYFRMHEIRTVPPAGESVGSGEAAPPHQIMLPALQTVLVTKAENMAQSTKQDYFVYMRRVFSQLSYPFGCDVSINLIRQNDFLSLASAFLRGKPVTSVALYKTTKSSPGYQFIAGAVDERAEDRVFQCEFNIEYFEDSTAMGHSLVTFSTSPELASLRRLWTTPRWACKLLDAGVPLRKLCTLIIHDLPTGSTFRLTTEDVAKALKPNAEVGVPCPAMTLLAVKCRVPRDPPRSDGPRGLAQLEQTSGILAMRETARVRMDAGYPLALQILVCGSNMADILHYDDRGQLSLHESDHGEGSSGSRLRQAFSRHWNSGALGDWVNT
ncbi:hypothetical protein C8Q70DRAFT_1054180 [Cubamyces menziesii]|uniref:F-box domain-containing protein n=1 Tax=Trametes cubensis TaxID=1111947 RepID=A0AAD7TPF2_9APHY|nr:hypothetical protein C8Q70DRAFT_1054180 [Cubamyces menziesii]KAJ8469193.1 hypothetical protein ONZ51_g9156 [Trametes cubensis]